MKNIYLEERLETCISFFQILDFMIVLLVGEEERSS
jgi:hypothetical protein